MHSNKPLLEICDLHLFFKVYNGRSYVLDGVNIAVNAGEKIGLVGESGCGKTTTVKSILRILPKQAVVTHGKIILDGDNILDMDKNSIDEMRRKKLSMIFQDPTASLNPVFTIGKQIRDTIKYSGLVKGNDKKKIHEIAIKALKDCSMPDPERIMKNYPFQLSGGMRQRICIAMALATASTLLIADEPTTNLDVTIQDQVLNLIKGLSEDNNMSLILITHSLGVARENTDRIYVMYAGNIVEMAPTELIFEEPLHPYTIGLLESIPKLTGEGIMSGIAGYVPSYINPPKGCRFESRCQYSFDRCRSEKPPTFNMGNGHTVNCFLYENDSICSSKGGVNND